MSQDRLTKLIDAIDKENSADPTIDGGKPAAVLYSERMSDRLAALAPDATEALRIASRAQHIRRWEIPRDRYPMDRTGYHQWRNELKKFHAECVSQLMKREGYDTALIEQVSAIVQKKGLKRNPDAQTLEDVACLVFLEHAFANFRGKHPPEKVRQILKKTWAKMSDKGREAAVELPLSSEDKALISSAIEPANPPH